MPGVHHFPNGVVKIKYPTAQVSGLQPGLTLAQKFLEDQWGEGDELDEGEEIGGC